MKTISKPCFANEDGESRFENLDYPLTDAGAIGFLSVGINVTELIFGNVSPTYDDFHTAPRR